MALNVSGKTALVTGGGSGICLEFSKLLLAHGCNVVIADLKLCPEAEEVVKSSRNDNNNDNTRGKAQAIFVTTDVTNWGDLQAAFDAAIKEFGVLDIVCPGAGIFEPPFSNFWHFKTGVDTISTSSYKTLDINITHPIRATQLAIDSFVRQKHGHGVVVIISSIAAQLALLPTPLYAASKHAVSGFTRSMADLEPKLNIRVNAVAPGIVKTPIWTTDKLAWVDEEVDIWITPLQVAQVMLDLIQDPKNVGGTVLEVGADKIRSVQELNDPGPQGKGHTVGKLAGSFADVYGLIEAQFGK